VSVILPTHNRARLLQRAVASIEAQTFRDFELIVIDDGSGDRTAETLASLAGTVNRISQSHRGVSAARNAGLAHATGELIAFLDDDDRWLPDHLSVVVTLLRGHPDAVLASTSPAHRRGGRQRPEQARVVDAFPAILTRSVAGFLPSTAVRRAEIEAVGGFDESLAANEDNDLWLRLSVRGPFVVLHRRTVALGRTPASLSVRARRDGSELAANRRSLLSMERSLEQAQNRSAAASVRGARSYLEALQALDAGDTKAVAHHLAAACEALPALSQEWIQALYMLRLAPSINRPGVRMRHLSTLAEAWPDRGTPTGLALHRHAALTALRQARIPTAGRLLRDAPLGDLLRFAVVEELHAARRRLTTLADLSQHLVARFRS
jgi:cellulose synthase/poly-beta-1,6-N-acetylglucosamine synthase-like glycosyltransferase